MADWGGRTLLTLGGGAGAAANGRIAARLGLDERVVPLDEDAAGVLAAGPRLVAVEVAGADEAVLDPVIDAAARLADRPGHGVAIVFPAALIDRVAAAATAPGLVLLCDPDEAERAAGIALATARAETAPALSERQATDRLGQIAEQVAEIARLLADLSDERPAVIARGGAAAGAIDAGFVRRLIRVRRMRDRHFDAALFGEPAWDMLLDLAAARAEGVDVAVSSLCIAAAVPPTTALRWIGTMERAGLIVRRADPADGRRAFLALGEDAAGAMATWLGEATEVLRGG